MLCCAVNCIFGSGAPSCKKINDYSQCGGEGNACPPELGGKCIDGPWKGETQKKRSKATKQVIFGEWLA
jgi:hypothetical protein